MRILLVEDDDRIAKPLAEDLRHQQYVVDLAADGEAGWDYAESLDYDLILLDLMLPKLDGISLCKRLRADGYSGFVLMLTAKDTTSDKVMGLDAGADDYLIKPFELEELSARIRALARRPPQLQSNLRQVGSLTLDETTHQIAYSETVLPLTPKEYLLLECLMRRPGQVFTCAMLIDKLWELDKDSSDATIRTHFTNLRRKLKLAGCTDKKIIETIYGVGYRLRLPQT